MTADSVFLDTNILVAATTPTREMHRVALGVFDALPNRGLSLCLSGQVLREYLVVATREPDINGLGLSLEKALMNVRAFRDRARFLPENAAVSRRFEELLSEIPTSGRAIHDAHLVATALAHEVGTLLTLNVKDFRRFGEHIELRTLVAT
jgi:predicted nucleic acid-binding protein